MNNIVYGTGIIVNGRTVVKNGVEYQVPKNVKGNNVTIINNEVFIDGYELKKNGTWKRTWRAFFHKYF